MGANDMSGDAEVVVSGKPNPADVTTNLATIGKRVTTNAQTSAEQNVMLEILRDLVTTMRQKGLGIEMYDARPDEQAAVVVIPQAVYCATCDRFTTGSGNICGACGNDVTAESQSP